MIVLIGDCMLAILEGAVGCSRETLSADSTNAVVSKLLGLLQPESEEILIF